MKVAFTANEQRDQHTDYNHIYKYVTQIYRHLNFMGALIVRISHFQTCQIGCATVFEYVSVAPPMWHVY